MSAPTPYTLSYDFTAFQVANPTTPLPADKHEIEYNNIALTTGEIITNLGLIQRSDGALVNGIVTTDALAPSILEILGAGSGDIATVAANIANINIVAGIDTEITALAALDTEIAALGAITVGIAAVAANEANIDLVAGSIGNVNTVAGIMPDVIRVGNNSANVTTVAGIDTEITTLSGLVVEITRLGLITGAISAVAAVDDEVVIVAGMAGDLAAVGAIAADVTAVANIAADVTAVGAIAANVTAVANIAADVTVVANNIASVVDAANNIPKANRSATTDPTVNDDSADGYSEASIWVNTISNEVFFCGDPAVGAAVWVSVTGAGAFSSLSDVTLTGVATGDMLRYDGADWVNRTAAQTRTDLSLVVGTNVQAYDADLAAIAGLTSAANKGIIFTGAGTAATYDLSAFALTLLDDADQSAMKTTLGLVIGTNVQAYNANLTTYAGIAPSANVQSLLGAADYSAMRTQLGLVIGTNVQAYDAELAAIAGLTSAADRLPYFTGAGTASLATFTSAARDLLDDTDATTMRTTLGLGSVAVAALIDDDTMATATATNIPSAESVKAYVDANGGKLIDYDHSNTSTQTSFTTPTIPADGTIPQIGEGNEILTVTVTTTTATQVVEIAGIWQAAHTSGTTYVAHALFVGSTANALNANFFYWANANRGGSMPFHHVHAPGAAGTYTYRLRIGVDNGTLYLNRSQADATLYGGAIRSFLTAKVIEP